MDKIAKERFWNQATQTTDFNAEWKGRQARFLNRELARRGLVLGSVILDVGSGPSPVSKLFSSEGSKVITVDLVPPANPKDTNLHIKQDIEGLLNPSSFQRRKSLVQSAKELGLDTHTGPVEQVDSLIFSDILNYLPSRQLISESMTYLKKGGLVIIFNQPGRTFPGMDPLVHPGGVLDNKHLIDYLIQELGMTEVVKNVTKEGYLVGVFQKT